jgi:peptidyl-tRNA hydrolase
MNAKLIIAVRTDLVDTKGKPVPLGKLAGQIARAAYLWMLPESRKLSLVSLKWFPVSALNEAEIDWLGSDLNTLIAVEAGTEHDLLQLIKSVEQAGVRTTPIYDAGLTCFGGQRTLTCASFGPAFPDRIDPVTRHLKLLR